MLHEKQLEAAIMLAEGKNKTEIATELKISRQTLYDWLKLEEFNEEVNHIVTLTKEETEKRLTFNIDKYVKELEKIAFNSKSEKIKSDTLQYLIDRVLGKTTTKVQDISEPKETKKDKELTWEDLAKMEKVKVLKRK